MSEDALESKYKEIENEYIKKMDYFFIAKQEYMKEHDIFVKASEQYTKAKEKFRLSLHELESIIKSELIGIESNEKKIESPIETITIEDIPIPVLAPSEPEEILIRAISSAKVNIPGFLNKKLSDEQLEEWNSAILPQLQKEDHKKLAPKINYGHQSLYHWKKGKVPSIDGFNVLKNYFTNKSEKKLIIRRKEDKKIGRPAQLSEDQKSLIIKRLNKHDITVSDLAKEFGVSRETIYRIQKKELENEN